MSASESLREAMKARLRRLVPEVEIDVKAGLVEEINRLKAERKAVILGHNYMEPALYHFVADHRGDSLELCRKAASTEADVIVFCGVRFMAETAKIISPEKKVLIPSLEAGCSLASSVSAQDVRALREAYPGVPVVSYVNTYADVKAESDYCVTSGNARKVIESIGADTVIYLPDEYMARNLARETGKDVFFPGETAKARGNAILGWHGKCEVHEKFRVEDVRDARRQYPGVVVLAHPECPPEVAEAADFCGSTAAMIRYVKERPAPHYLLLTECSMGDNIIAENPDRDILRLCSFRCPHMNLITLDQTLASLRDLRFEVDVLESVRIRARRSIDRMLAVG